MVIVKLGLVILMIFILLRKKVAIGNAILASSFLLWGLSGFDFSGLGNAFVTTLRDPRGWIIVGALYFIMWLEYLFRTRGIMDSFLLSIQQTIPNRKAVMMIIAAFLGLLPSMGGAIFSAPMVKKLAEPLDMTTTDQSLTNFWSRHLVDYTNPMAPALLLASTTVQVPVGEMLIHLVGYGVLAVILGWFFCFPQVPNVLPEHHKQTMGHQKTLILALSPIVAIFILILVFKLNAGIATFLATSVLTIILWRGFSDFKRQVTESFNVKIFWTVGVILFFQNVLVNTGMVSGLIDYFQQTGLSPAVGISILAFIMGALTGMMQGFVAIVFPFVAGAALGDVTFAVLIYVVGVSGQMMTPTHLCMTLTMDYFKADWGIFYKKLIPMQLTIMFAGILVYWMKVTLM